MKFSKILTVAATALLILTSCGVDKTAGTVGDGNPDKPNVSVGKLDFYPNYDAATQSASPMASTRPDHPGYLYMVFYQGEVRGMNVLEEGDEITIDQQYTVTFSDPSNYTLLMAKRDRFALLTLLGAAVTMAGMIMAFYLRKR